MIRTCFWETEKAKNSGKKCRFSGLKLITAYSVEPSPIAIHIRLMTIGIQIPDVDFIVNPSFLSNLVKNRDF